MAVKRKTLVVCHCERCGYEWVPRGEALPKVCANPKCHSPYWNRPRRKPKAKKSAR